ncbi:hypothetical protein [Helicobacter salomonis]|uniref:hypothetical protein n=1 Tax=Helicobacter salomonis TaxID=56878 RepID=UPI0013157A42|nr:hypothetical protein [Helicobacter salomonis]
MQKRIPAAPHHPKTIVEHFKRKNSHFLEAIREFVLKIQANLDLKKCPKNRF